MSRYFSKEVKRQALARAQGKCEAVGPLYGLPEGVRCNANLGMGFDWDHVVAWSISGDSGADNCACICRPCHRFKSTKHDTPRAAKTKRQADKANGIRNDRGRMAGGKKSRFKKKLDGTVVMR